MGGFTVIIDIEIYERLPDKFKKMFTLKKSESVEKVFMDQGGVTPSSARKTPSYGKHESSGFKGLGNRGEINHSDTGSVSRYFNKLPITDLDAPFLYCAKASKKERNEGLDSQELVWEKSIWEKQDLNSLTENISQLSRGISGDILTEDKPWSTDIYGHSISETYPEGMISTISMVIKLITELKTLSASQSLIIKDTIQDAIKTIETNGLNLAKSVEFLSQLDMSTINEKTGSLLGAVNVVLIELSKIRSHANSGNFHSTVKPIALMNWLIKLVTPKGGTILDPFMGSGTTGVAAKDFRFFGIERDKDYFEIAKKRIEASR